MTDIEILTDDGFRRSVEENLDRDPVLIALDTRVPNAAAVASQVKYLRRAEVKLPSWFAARCIVPPLAFEQSSSEATAARKGFAGVGGESSGSPASGLCIDLTCGLGVDSLYLSRRFERVIAVERDPWLAAASRENFRRLGARNIEVVNASAEEFLADFAAGTTGSGEGFGGRADLVYVDPDRRDASGKKMVRMEDCSPDVVALLPVIERVTRRLVVKLSPLFDVDEVFRVFGQRARAEKDGGPGASVRNKVRAEVVSVAGECKEIVAEITFGEFLEPDSGKTGTSLGEPAKPLIGAVAVGIGQVEYPFGERDVPAESVQPERDFRTTGVFEPERYRYLIVPDVALQKARLARRYFHDLADNHNAAAIYIDSDNGYAFAAEDPDGEKLLGRVYEIEAIEPFDPKALKRRLKAEGVKNVDIMKRDFPLSAAEIARRIGVQESSPKGGAKSAGTKGNAKAGSAAGKNKKTTLVFTKVAGRLWQIKIRQDRRYHENPIRS